jgi:hypothetical protein
VCSRRCQCPLARARGDSLLSYVGTPQYADIVTAEWTLFEPLLGASARAAYHFAEHAKRLTAADVERMKVRAGLAPCRQLPVSSPQHPQRGPP